MMFHQDDNIKGDLQPKNLNRQCLNAPGFHSATNTEQAALYGSNYQNQHSFQSIPPFNFPPRPPAPSGGLMNLMNEGNTSNTQAHGSFQSKSAESAQYFSGGQFNPPFQSFGSKPSISSHNFSNSLTQPSFNKPPPQPSFNNPPPLPSFNYGNQPQYYGSQLQPPQPYGNQRFHQPHPSGNPSPNIIGNQTSRPFQNYENRSPQIYGDQTVGSYGFKLGASNIPPPQGECFQSQNILPPRPNHPPRPSIGIETVFNFPPPLVVQPHRRTNLSPNVCYESKADIHHSDQTEKWMKEWMNKIRKRKEKDKNRTSDLKIYEIQKKLLRYAILVNELDKILESLSRPSEEDQNKWESAIQNAENLKKELEELRSFFDEKQTQNRIQEILTRRREKRIKWRTGRAERAKKRKRIREERQIKEKKMDNRIKMLNDEEKEKLQEEKMKQEADSVLREVRTKQEDVLKMQKMLEALTKLRDIRKKKGEMHGFIDDSFANAFFAKMKKEFESLLSDQQNLYFSEEQTLKIMMEESRTTSSLPKIAPENRSLNLNQLKKSIWEIYFGKNDPKNEYEKSFLASEESIEILVKRRKDWDQYLVSDDTPVGSSVPLGWVVPNSEPNEDWKTFQQSV